MEVRQYHNYLISQLLGNKQYELSKIKSSLPTLSEEAMTKSLLTTWYNNVWRVKLHSREEDKGEIFHNTKFHIIIEFIYLIHSTHKFRKYQCKTRQQESSQRSGFTAKNV